MFSKEKKAFNKLGKFVVLELLEQFLFGTIFVEQNILQQKTSEVSVTVFVKNIIYIPQKAACKPLSLPLGL